MRNMKDSFCLKSCRYSAVDNENLLSYFPSSSLAFSTVEEREQVLMSNKHKLTLSIYDSGFSAELAKEQAFEQGGKG